VAEALAEIDQEISHGIAASGTSWEGVAADRARTGIGPLIEWAGQARTGAEVMRLSAELQADYVSKARAEMPRPVEVTSERPNAVVRGLTHLFGGQTDYEIQEAERDSAEQRAFQVMSDYESNTAGNTGSLGRFSPPPEVVVGAAAPMHGDGAGAAAHRSSGGVRVRDAAPARAGATGRREGGRRVVRPAAGADPGELGHGPATTGPGHGTTSRVGAAPGHAPETPATAPASRMPASAPDGPAPGSDYLIRAEDGFGSGMMVSPPVIGGET
jgi:hypothetical protein